MKEKSTVKYDEEDMKNYALSILKYPNTELNEQVTTLARRINEAIEEAYEKHMTVNSVMLNSKYCYIPPIYNRTGVQETGPIICGLHLDPSLPLPNEYDFAVYYNAMHDKLTVEDILKAFAPFRALSQNFARVYAEIEEKLRR